MTLIHTIAEKDADGILQEVYQQIRKATGAVPEVFRASSLAPRVLEAHWRLHRALLSGPAPLSAAKRELLGLTVSQVNHCHY